MNHLRKRAGVTLLEVTTAGVILSVVMAITLQLTAWMVAERRLIERKQWALEEAANRMEELTASGWSGATPEAAASLRLSAEATRVLPGSVLSATVMDETGELRARRVTIEIRWQNRAGTPAAPVRLVSWLYSPGGSS